MVEPQQHCALQVLVPSVNAISGAARHGLMTLITRPQNKHRCCNCVIKTNLRTYVWTNTHCCMPFYSPLPSTSCASFRSSYYLHTVRDQRVIRAAPRVSTLLISMATGGPAGGMPTPSAAAAKAPPVEKAPDKQVRWAEQHAVVTIKDGDHASFRPLPAAPTDGSAPAQPASKNQLGVLELLFWLAVAAAPPIFAALLGVLARYLEASYDPAGL